jgi:N-acetylneuraminic acid mutarotase
MYASGFGIGHKGYITCGSYINIQPLNDLWEWDEQTNLWAQKANLPGSARANATAFSVGLKGYVFGGTDGTSALNDLWEYDPGADSWTQKVSLPGQGRTDAVAFSIGEYVYIIGGWSGGGDALSDVWQYNTLTDSWAQLPDFPGIPTAGGTAFSINNLGYIAGGYGTTECWEYDPLGVGMPEYSLANFSFHPNPSSDKIFISFNTTTTGSFRIDISDMTGRSVYNEVIAKANGLSVSSKDVSFIKPGIYIISIYIDEIRWSEKLIIQP